jgi:hypothetical protein
MKGKKTKTSTLRNLSNKAKAKNKSIKLDKESNNHENNLVTFSYSGN